MANIIDPNGLFGGDRMNQLSDEARLYWPFYFLGSNGYGRIEINHRLIVGSIFHGFRQPPTNAGMIGHFREYRDQYLCFIYESSGVTWGQFWVPDSKLLPRWKTAATKKSPDPPKTDYAAWLKEYESQKVEIRALQNYFGELPKSFESSSEKLPLGIGIGEGIGIGVGEGKDLRPSGSVFFADEGYQAFKEIYEPLKDYGLKGTDPMHAYIAEVGDSPNAEAIHLKIMEGVARMAASGTKPHHMPTAEKFLSKQRYLERWAVEEPQKAGASKGPRSAYEEMKEMGI